MSCFYGSSQVQLLVLDTRTSLSTTIDQRRAGAQYTEFPYFPVSVREYHVLGVPQDFRMHRSPHKPIPLFVRIAD